MGTRLSAFCEKVVEAGWLTAIVTVPLFFNIYTARSYEPDKVALLRTMAGLMFAAWVIATVEKGIGHWDWQSALRTLRGWLKRPLVLPVVVLVFSFGISSVFSISVQQSAWGSYTRLQGLYSALAYILIFALVAHYLRTRDQLQRLVSAVILASLPVTLYAILQQLGLDPLASSATGSRVRANLGNAIFLASYLIMVVPLTVVRLIESWKAVKRDQKRSFRAILLTATYLSLVVLQLVVVFLTKSRGPMVGLGVGALLFGLLVFHRLSSRQRFVWAALAVLAVSVLLVANLRNVPFSSFLQPLTEISHVNRLTTILDTEGRTAQVRILTWDSAFDLMLSDEPLGINGDEISGEDRFHHLRPIMGYGPETIFNSMSRVFPPRLAHIEGYNRQADRSHNETIDLLLTNGLLGGLAFYLLMFGLFVVTLRSLGLVPHRAAKRSLLTLMLSGSVLGGVVAYLADSNGSRFTFVALGVPVGLVGGVLLYVWVRRMTGPERRQPPELLLVGFFSALVAHFIEIHFVFSFSATYLYFWIYAGAVLAVAKNLQLWSAGAPDTKSRKDRAGRPQDAAEVIQESKPREQAGQEIGAAGVERYVTGLTSGEAAYSILAALVLVILSYDFLLADIPFTLGVVVMLLLTWAVGLILVTSERPMESGIRTDFSVRLIGSYLAITVGLLLLFTLGVRVVITQVPRLLNSERLDSLAAGRIGAAAFFWAFLLSLLLALAYSLAPRWKGIPLFSRGWKFVLHAAVVVWIGYLGIAQNFNEIRGDIYLKRSEGLQNRGEWDRAIRLILAAHNADPEEDQYCLRLANAYQRKAADRELTSADRIEAVQQGERFAHAALRLNPYNPDHHVNLGRYLFSLGPARFEEALESTRKATLLAPGRVAFRFLLAQIHFRARDFEEAIVELRACNTIDDRYPLAWLLLGDVYLQLNRVSEALQAHSRGFNLQVRRLDGFASFADESLDGRLRAYSMAGKIPQLVDSLESLAARRPTDGAIPWVIGRAHYLNGQTDSAAQHFRKCIPLLEAARSSGSAPGGQERLALAYILVGRAEEGVELVCRIKGDSCETELFELGVELVSRQLYSPASIAFAKVVELNENNASAHKNLGVMYYYHLDRQEEGLRHFRKVLELQPNRSDAGEIRLLVQSQ